MKKYENFDLNLKVLEKAGDENLENEFIIREEVKTRYRDIL